MVNKLNFIFIFIFIITLLFQLQITITTSNNQKQIINKTTKTNQQQQLTNQNQNQNQTEKQIQNQLQDDLFQTIFPPPFRILSLFALTLLSWAITLHILRSCNLNLAHLLHQSTTLTSQLYSPVYYAAISLFLLILLGMVIHQITSNYLKLIPPDHSQLISSLPAFILLIIPFRLAPFSIHFRSAHRRLQRTLIRIFSFNLHSITLFPDIILADLLTSLARPFAQIGLLLSNLLHLNPNLQLTLSIALNCLPFLLRLKQCINDAIIGPGKTKSIMNGIKYTTAIPMIILSSKIKTFSTETLDSNLEIQERNSKVKLWIIASLINSIYSTWWDNVNDWGIGLKELMGWLSQFQNRFKADLIPINRHHHHHHHQSPTIQQGRILFNQNNWWGYIILMMINFTLRMTWIIGLYTGPNMIGVKLEYTMQLLEIIRRWMWCLVRLEWAEMNHKKEHEFYVDLTSPTLQEFGSSSIDESDLFHEHDNDDDDDNEKNSDGPILHLERHPHLHRPIDHSKDLLLKPSSSSSSSTIQNYQLDLSYDLNLLESNR